MLILNNATIYLSRMVKCFLKRHRWVDLQHLMPYSPAFNPIARLWQWLKAKVYGATTFDTIEAIIAKIRQLTWHYNERQLKTYIHVEFTAYAKIL